MAIGTDSAASNNDLDLLGEMRTAALLAKGVSGDASSVPAATALRMITINAARALGIDQHTGSLGSWQSCRLYLHSTRPTLTPMYFRCRHIAYCAGRERVRDVWVAGKHLLADRELTTMDSQTDKPQCRRLVCANQDRHKYSVCLLIRLCQIKHDNEQSSNSQYVPTS